MKIIQRLSIYLTPSCPRFIDHLVQLLILLPLLILMLFLHVYTLFRVPQVFTQCSFSVSGSSLRCQITAVMSPQASLNYDHFSDFPRFR